METKVFKKMSKIFNVTQSPKVGRNKFDLSFDSKVSMNAGELVPILMKPVIPGDEFRVNTETLVRLQPLVAPMMHRVNVDVHYFYVPSRIVWTEFEKFITGGEQGTDAPVVPYLSNYTASPGTLLDYMGIPDVGGAAATAITSLPFRAYQLIFNEYYRDQNLESKVSIPTGSGNDSASLAALTTMRTRAYEKDYFTSALPWTQRGAPVSLPITNSVSYSSFSIERTQTGGVPAAGNLHTNAGSGTLLDGGGTPSRVENISGIDSSITVEDLRKSTKIQQFLELAARVGSRYSEQLMGFFGVKSDDLRLQRPAYLGGGRTPVMVSEIPQSSESGTTPQGNLAGHGISVGNTNKMNYYFKEHGYLFAIMSVLPRTGYQQGYPKHYFIDDKFDLPWPQFAQLGEVPVSQGEIYATGTDSADRYQVFGYQSRYADYKSYHNEVHGDFKSSLLNWHMGRVFSSAPALNASFVKPDATSTHRVFAVTDPNYDKYLVNIYHNIQAKRPLPFFNNPSLL